MSKIVRRDSGIVPASALAFGAEREPRLVERASDLDLRQRGVFRVDPNRTLGTRYGWVLLPPRKMTYIAVWPRQNWWPENLVVTEGVDPRIYIDRFDVFADSPGPTDQQIVTREGAPGRFVYEARIGQYTIDYANARAFGNLDWPLACLEGDCVRLAIGNEWDEPRRVELRLIGKGSAP